MNNLTVEQALNNVAVAVEKFVGTKAEHISLEHSMAVLKQEIAKLKFLPKEETQTNEN